MFHNTVYQLLFLHLIYMTRDSMAKQVCPFHFSSHHVFFIIFCFCVPILKLVAFYPFSYSAAKDRWTQYEVKCIFSLVFILKLQMNIIRKNDYEIPPMLEFSSLFLYHFFETHSMIVPVACDSRTVPFSPYYFQAFLTSTFTNQTSNCL